MNKLPLYRRLATYYQEAIESGILAQGERFPSMRTMMARHEVSLSTALQVCRQLEKDGWLEARARSGNFVRRPRRIAPLTLEEPRIGLPLDPAQYVGIHRQ